MIEHGDFGVSFVEELAVDVDFHGSVKSEAGGRPCAGGAAS